MATAKDEIATLLRKTFDVKYGDQWKQGEMEIRDKENVIQKRSREKPEKGHLDGSVN